MSWVEVNNSGLPWGARLVAAARGSDVVYAAVADPNILFPGAIYKSTNGGASWAATGAAPIAAGQGWFNDIVIDPKNPDVVYAPFHFGVYKTTNGGTSWALMAFPGIPNPQTWALSVSIDPQFSSTLLVSRMSDGALARTVDGGANWQRIEINDPGSNLKALNRALFNPARPGQDHRRCRALGYRRVRCRNGPGTGHFGRGSQRRDIGEHFRFDRYREPRPPCGLAVAGGHHPARLDGAHDASRLHAQRPGTQL